MALKSQPARSRCAPIVLGLSVLVLGACGGKSSSTPAEEGFEAETAPNMVQPGAPGQGTKTLSAAEFSAIGAPTFVDADVLFMQGMIHHHAQALRMTALVPRRSTGNELPLLAERMDLSQTAEIEQMQRWLRDRDQGVPVLHQAHQHAHGPGAGLMMPGMLTEQQLRRLGQARGEEFNKLFLTFMIHHHEGALTMVRQLYAANGGAEPETDAFARHVEADQRIEIARMKAMLAEMR
jgi:uncharacterized protein (DUF305 family)